MKKSVFALVLLVFALGCVKEKIVTGNEPPPDPTVEDIQIENFVKDAHLHLLGRLPDLNELPTAFAELRKNNASRASRLAFLNGVAAKPSYLFRQFQLESLLMLNGKADDQGYLDYLRDRFETELADPDHAPEWPFIQRDLERVKLLDAAKEAYLDKKIEHVELLARMSDNRMFMYETGNLPWVQAVCLRLLLREPTEAEIDQFYQASATLETFFFGKPAKSMDDLRENFFGSVEFAEGTVRRVFLSYLFREPTAAELQDLAPKFYASKDLAAIQIAVLASDEFLF